MNIIQNHNLNTMSTSFDPKQYKFAKAFRADGLAASFRFNETSGNFYDTSGTTGVSLLDYGLPNIHSSGGILSSNCAYFDGTYFIQIPDISSHIYLHEKVSFCVWLKTTVVPLGKYVVRFVGSTGSPDIRLYITNGPSSTLYIRIGDLKISGGNNEIQSECTVPQSLIVDGNWHFIVFTIDRTLSGIDQHKIYIDNVEKTLSLYYSQGSDPSGDVGKVNIIVGGSPSSYYITGYIDSLLVFDNKTLTTEEISNLYNSGSGVEI